jgi:hypothetical protein
MEGCDLFSLFNDHLSLRIYIYVRIDGKREDLADYFEVVSEALDEIVYGPFYRANLATDHMNMAETIAACKSSRRIEERLKSVKVTCCALSLFSFVISLYSIMRGSLPKGALCLFLSADLLRVSYNCYIKNYCAIFIRKYFGSISRVGESIFQMAKAAVGLADPSEDPLAKIKHEVMWEVLMEDTLSKLAYLKVSKPYNCLLGDDNSCSTSCRKSLSNRASRLSEDFGY